MSNDKRDSKTIPTDNEENADDSQQQESNIENNNSTTEDTNINRANDEDDIAGMQLNRFSSNNNRPLLSQASKASNVTAKASSTNQTGTRHSELFVLHTQRGNVSVNRRCHLPRSEGVNVKARRKLIIASIFCLFFVLCEIIGGILSNSLAVAADAAHTLTDFAGFMISLFAIWLAGRKSTDRLSFGWYRAEVIGALGSVMTIWFVTAILVWLAIQRCISRDFEIAAPAMIITSIFGIITNAIIGIYLIYGTSTVEMNCDSNENLQASISKHLGQSHGHGHGHGHHHSHGSGIFGKLAALCGNCYKFKRKRQSHDAANGDAVRERCAQNAENINVKAAYLHVLGDGLQSVGVLIAGIVIFFNPTWTIVDPICTFLFSIIILYTTFNILKDIIVVLMEGTPTHMDYNEVQHTFEQIPGVKSIHHLRIWALSLDKIALAVHLVIEHGKDPHDILLLAEEVIHKHYNLFETTIQIEEE